MNTVELNNSTSSAAFYVALKGVADATAMLAQHCATLVGALSESQSATNPMSAHKASSKPTSEQCAENQNKIGVNLSPRGVELIYRLYDHGSSVRAASMAMRISHRAAKWRKAAWEKAGAQNRPFTILDID